MKDWKLRRVCEGRIENTEVTDGRRLGIGRNGRTPSPEEEGGTADAGEKCSRDRLNYG